MGVNINNAQICSLPCPGSLSTQTQGEDPDVLSSITTLCFGRLLPWWLYFINICWRRRIPNLSRALFQISLSGLNEDWSRCRCYCGFFFFYPPFFLSQWIKIKKNDDRMSNVCEKTSFPFSSVRSGDVKASWFTCTTQMSIVPPLQKANSGQSCTSHVSG